MLEPENLFLQALRHQIKKWFPEASIKVRNTPYSSCKLYECEHGLTVEFPIKYVGSSLPYYLVFNLEHDLQKNTLEFFFQRGIYPHHEDLFVLNLDENKDFLDKLFSKILKFKTQKTLEFLEIRKQNKEANELEERKNKFHKKQQSNSARSLVTQTPLSLPSGQIFSMNVSESDKTKLLIKKIIKEVLEDDYRRYPEFYEFPDYDEHVLQKDIKHQVDNPLVDKNVSTVNEAEKTQHASDRFRERFLNKAPKTIAFEIQGTHGSYDDVGEKTLEAEKVIEIQNNINIVQQYNFPRNKSYAIKIGDLFINPNSVLFYSEDDKIKAKGKILVYRDNTLSNGNLAYAIVRNNDIETIMFAKSYSTIDANKFRVDVLVQKIQNLIDKKIY